MTRYPLITLTALAASGALAPSPAQAPRLRDLDTYVAKAVRDWGVPGLAIAVVRNDSYQNVMYGAAGQVGAAASGMPWEDFIRARIFRPLGMTESVPTAAVAARSTNRASPHFQIDDTVRVITSDTAGANPAAGAVWSSARHSQMSGGHR
jgi:CubicO group peptidase (beta-lactamase class C family)